VCRQKNQSVECECDKCLSCKTQNYSLILSKFVSAFSAPHIENIVKEEKHLQATKTKSLSKKERGL
jgi:hypothetical protein